MSVSVGVKDGVKVDVGVRVGRGVDVRVSIRVGRRVRVGVDVNVPEQSLAANTFVAALFPVTTILTPPLDPAPNSWLAKIHWLS